MNEIDFNDIDFVKLRSDLEDYFGTASPYFAIAQADLVNVDSCDDLELLSLINKTTLNIYDYLKNKSL